MRGQPSAPCHASFQKQTQLHDQVEPSMNDTIDAGELPLDKALADTWACTHSQQKHWLRDRFTGAQNSGPTYNESMPLIIWV